MPSKRRSGCWKVLPLTLLICLASGGAGRAELEPNEEEGFPRAVVAADHPLAARAGLQMLEQGGNVVDAAVATSFALSVVRPYSSGLGGGGFMVIWNAERGEAVALDYRERAPQRAHRDLFVDARDPDLPPELISQKGMLAVGVPGTVAGLAYALEHYGKLDLATVLQPAIRLARDGYRLDDHDRETHRNLLRQFARRPAYRPRFATLYEQYLFGGQTPDAEVPVTSPQLAALELIARDGPDAFYRGPIARALVALSDDQGGLLSAEDLAAVRPVVRQPLRGSFDGAEILTMPPPSSGGVALLQILNTLAAWEAQGNRRFQTLEERDPESIQALVEAMKHAYADRAAFLADADFVDVPVDRLISPAYAAEIARQIDSGQTREPAAYGAAALGAGGTSHLSVIDARGNAVACTETINLGFGSWVVEPTYGIVLNNQMDDFTARPGEPNAFGLIQSDKNAVQPGKKPLSSMTPTIVLRDGRATHSLGASGGPRIISATLQVLLHMVRFGQSPAEAVRQPRLHHQWMPDQVLVEEPLDTTLGDLLQQFGHTVVRRSPLGVCQAVSRDATGLRGAGDPRKGGTAAGY